MFDFLNAARDRLCPHCFERFPLGTAAWRCSNGAGCATEDDAVYASYWRLSGAERNEAKKLPVWNGPNARDGQPCPKCRQKTRRRACPTCHEDLPEALLDTANRSILISLIGAKDTGKSHYLTVLIDHFRRRVGPDMGISVGHLTEPTIQRYKKDFHGPLFDRHERLPQTMSGVTTHTTRLPQIWGVSRARERKFWEREDKIDFGALVFFDTAGEDLNDTDVMAQVNRYIYQSDGIVLLLDPLQIDEIRSQLQGVVPLPPKETAPWQIVQSVHRLVREGQKLGQSQKVSIPVAVAFSKFDAVRELVNPQYQVLQSPDRSRGYDPADRRAVSDEMRRQLEKWDMRDLLQQLDTHFTTVSFFGVSALGAAPDAAGRVGPIVPHRVEDPLLWLLHRHNLVPTRAGR